MILLLAAAAQALPPAPPIATPPRIIAGNIVHADYPPAALRRGAQGLTRSRITLDSNGAVTSCVPADTSGDQLLDLHACRLALGRMRFSPARDAEGRGVAATVILPVRWALDGDPPLYRDPPTR